MYSKDSKISKFRTSYNLSISFTDSCILSVYFVLLTHKQNFEHVQVSLDRFEQNLIVIIISLGIYLFLSKNLKKDEKSHVMSNYTTVKLRMLGHSPGWTSNRNIKINIPGSQKSAEHRRSWLTFALNILPSMPAGAISPYETRVWNRSYCREFQLK